MAHVTNPKPSRTARKLSTFRERQERQRDEDLEKAKVRRRDRTCRFPLCGCKRLGLRLEVSHDFHKGMGSKRGVSLAPLMVLLCEHRHQHGAISRHAGTLQTRYLTPDQNDDAIAWDVDAELLERIGFRRETLKEHIVAGHDGHVWFNLAEEIDRGKVLLTPLQARVAKQLAEMEL